MSSGKINKILTYTKKCLDGSKKNFKSEEDLNNGIVNNLSLPLFDPSLYSNLFLHENS
jgi:hypothetical protein